MDARRGRRFAFFRRRARSRGSLAPLRAATGDIPRALAQQSPAPCSPAPAGQTTVAVSPSGTSSRTRPATSWSSIAGNWWCPVPGLRRARGRVLVPGRLDSGRPDIWLLSKRRPASTRTSSGRCARTAPGSRASRRTRVRRRDRRGRRTVLVDRLLARRSSDAPAGGGPVRLPCRAPTAAPRGRSSGRHARLVRIRSRLGARRTVSDVRPLARREPHGRLGGRYGRVGSAPPRAERPTAYAPASDAGRQVHHVQRRGCRDDRGSSQQDQRRAPLLDARSVVALRELRMVAELARRSPRRAGIPGGVVLTEPGRGDLRPIEPTGLRIGSVVVAGRRSGWSPRRTKRLRVVSASGGASVPIGLPRGERLAARLVAALARSRAAQGATRCSQSFRWILGQEANTALR